MTNSVLMLRKCALLTLLLAAIGIANLAVPDVAMAQEAAEATAEQASIPMEFIVNNLWIMIAGMLVFIMHLGFATLESGLTRSKNTVNILFKNTMIICIGF